MQRFLFVLAACLLGLMTKGQDRTHTMGYYTIEITPTSTNFFQRYLPPGKEGLCGFYSQYNNTMYFCEGGKLEIENKDYLHSALTPCCNVLRFDDGPKPYAMMQFDVEITKVDYETNKIYAKTDGANLVIETFNKDIDELYNKFYKNNQLGNVKLRLILKNWTYEPESQESYAFNTRKVKRKIRWKSKRAKNEELYLHKSEYMK